MIKTNIKFLALLLIVTFRLSAQNFGWAKHIGKTASFTEAVDISIDAQNNVYSCGKFAAGTDLDPGPNTYTLSVVAEGIYIQKLDASGNFLWAKSITASNHATASTIVSDTAGNIYIIGGFNG